MNGIFLGFLHLVRGSMPDLINHTSFELLLAPIKCNADILKTHSVPFLSKIELSTPNNIVHWIKGTSHEILVNGAMIT